MKGENRHVAASDTACKPILVTGLLRGGTTWIGQMLALAAEAEYFHEPFNGSIRRVVNPAAPPLWLTHIAPGEDPERARLMSELARFKYSLLDRSHRAAGG